MHQSKLLVHENWDLAIYLVKLDFLLDSKR